MDQQEENQLLQPGGPEQARKTLMQESFDELMDTRLVKFFDKMISSKHGIYWLPLIVLIDVYLLILPLEPILALYAIRNKAVKIWHITLVATVMSLIGYLSLYALGYYFSDSALDLFGRLIDRDQLEALGVMLNQSFSFAGIPLSLAAIFGFTSALASIPIPLTGYTLGVGVLQVSILPFTILFLAGRFIRYYLSAYLGREYGVKMLETTLKNIYIFTFFTVLGLAIVVYRFILI